MTKDSKKNMPPQQPTQTREQFIENLFQTGKKDNIYSDKDAREKLISGVNKAVDVIKESYGASGSNCIIEDTLLPYHRVTNDGKTIVDSIFLADPVENIGANIVKEVAAKSDKESGDGRKTSMILLQAILKEGAKCKESPMEIKRSLDECLPIILKSIDAQTTKITTKDIERVASVASESSEIGKLFGDIYKEIGQDGIIELDNSGIPDTFFEITEGVRLLNCRFHYQYMAESDKGRKVIRENPLVLITKQKITHLNQVDPIFKFAYKNGKKDVVIFCEDIEDSVSAHLFQYHQGFQTEMDGLVANLKFNVLVIKAPTLWKDWLYEDFAKITGATIIDGVTIQLKNLQPHHLGTCNKIISSKNETVVLGIKNINEHTEKLKEINTDESKIRLARLSTKTAILKIGANSESELSYKRGKVLDARNSSYLALEGGVVPGAGVTYLYSSKKLPETIGGKILSKALVYPSGQILKNMGTNASVDGDKIQDAATVVKNALTNALSIASTILTTSNVITLKK